jgi:hypothetical protein
MHELSHNVVISFYVCNGKFECITSMTYPQRSYKYAQNHTPQKDLNIFYLLMYTYTLPPHTYPQRWIVNGNVQCFKDLHLVIALIAIVILAVCVGVIPAILIYSRGILQVSACCV